MSATAFDGVAVAVGVADVGRLRRTFRRVDAVFGGTGETAYVWRVWRVGQGDVAVLVREPAEGCAAASRSGQIVPFGFSAQVVDDASAETAA